MMSNLPSGYLCKEVKSAYWKGILAPRSPQHPQGRIHLNVHWQEREENMVCTYNELLFSLSKEIIFQEYIHGPWRYCASRSQLQKNKYLHEVSTTNSEADNRKLGARGWGWKEIGNCSMGQSFSYRRSTTQRCVLQSKICSKGRSHVQCSYPNWKNEGEPCGRRWWDKTTMRAVSMNASAALWQAKITMRLCHSRIFNEENKSSTCATVPQQKVICKEETSPSTLQCSTVLF